jgi:hypothetical protein
MSSKRFSAGMLFLVILITPLVAAKDSDGPILLKIGKTAWGKIHDGLPEKAKVLGPLAALRPTDALLPADRVRVRIQTDKELAAFEIEVISTAEGEVTLRGTVPTPGHRIRAVDIARSTAGVKTVTDDLKSTVN